MREWAMSVVRKFMDGRSIGDRILEQACATVGVTVEDLRRCRREAQRVTRRMPRFFILTPTNGQRLGLPR